MKLKNLAAVLFFGVGTVTALSGLNIRFNIPKIENRENVYSLECLTDSNDIRNDIANSFEELRFSFHEYRTALNEVTKYISNIYILGGFLGMSLGTAMIIYNKK
ncbi:hypothetical protein J4230_00940 [Candidatus Woesearchaeota archaeon]|nr:hypothetical protein [Candidatus Woesearchaeota archaeon]